MTEQAGTILPDETPTVAVDADATDSAGAALRSLTLGTVSASIACLSLVPWVLGGITFVLLVLLPLLPFICWPTSGLGIWHGIKGLQSTRGSEAFGGIFLSIIGLGVSVLSIGSFLMAFVIDPIRC